MSLKQTHHTKPRIAKASLIIGILILMFVGIQLASRLPFVVAQGAGDSTTHATDTANVDSHAEESEVAVGEVSPIDEEQVVDEEEIQERAKKREAKLRAEAEERKRLAAMQEEDYLDGRLAMELEEAEFHSLRALEEEELLYREMLGREEGQVGALEALELAETPEGLLMSEAAVVPFGLLERRRASLSEDELITLMVEIASNDPENEVRMAAIRSIGRLGSEAASEALVSIYDSQENIGLKKTVLASLGWSRKSNALVLEKLQNIAASDPNPQLRKAALRGLAGLPGDDGVSAIVSIYDQTQEKDLKKFIIRFLSQGRSDEALEKLMDIARSDNDASLRLEAVQSLGSARGGPMIGYADAPIFAEPYISAVPVPAPAPPAPPALPKPPKEKQ